MKTSRSKESMQESFAALGLAIHLLHEIENHFSQATLLGLTEKQKRKHQSVNDMWAARDRMTFGQLVPLFKEDWDLQPEFELVLDKFVEERNIVVHRLTKLQGFGVSTQRERRKLNARLSKFVDVAFLMRKIFHGAYLASNEFARDWLTNHKGIEIPLETPEEWREDIDYFFAVAKYKHGAEQGVTRAKVSPRPWNWVKAHEIGCCYPVGEGR